MALAREIFYRPPVRDAPRTMQYGCPHSAMAPSTWRALPASISGMKPSSAWFWLAAALFPVGFPPPHAAAQAGPTTLTLHLRSLPKDAADAPVEKTVRWDPKKTALIICDMWDQHWCRSAERRVAEMAPRLNAVVEEARRRGVFILHAPSTCTAFYEGTPQRERAKKAPHSPTPAPLATTPRWGTAWCWTDPKHEAVLPIDDSDGGCDCSGEKCEIRTPWTRQIASIPLAGEDAVTDDGQETWNLLQARGIDHVILCGVHLNMCVLGRPFAIRQMVKLGKDVALMRDMTDTMYNPERPPGLDHFAGTDLVVAHVERHWCPSFTSADLVGGRPFRFAADPRSGTAVPARGP